MTAETLKPFLSGAAGSPNASNGQKSIVVSMVNTTQSEAAAEEERAQRNGGRPSPLLVARKNALLFSFCAIVSICVAALIGVEIWNSLRATRLQNEVQQLSAELKGLMRFLQLDKIQNLDELADAYREGTLKHPIQNEYDVLSAQYDVSAENSDSDLDGHNQSQLGDYLLESDDDYYEDGDIYPHGSGDDDEDDDDDSDADEMKGSPMYEDVDVPDRKRRSLTENHRYGSLVESSNKDDIMQHIIPFQEVSPDEANDERVALDHSERPKSRRSRVITSLNERMAKMAPTKKEQFLTAQSKKKEGHKRHNVRSMAHMRKNLVTRNARRTYPVAVHYVGHTDHYNANYHSHYAGNGRLQHHGGVYADWKPANWTNTLMSERYFRMEHGVVTVHEAGLYHVYAQIYYYDVADESSFWVDHNERHFLQCATTVISSGTVPKASTCYTAGLVYLQSGDRIRVHDLMRHYALLKPERSFFGLVRLAAGISPPTSTARSGEEAVGFV